MERVMGIEPTRLAWKARALPLSYTRKWSERRDSSLLRHPWRTRHLAIHGKCKLCDPGVAVSSLSIAFYLTKKYNTICVLLYNGAEDGIRTRDPRLGKAILYH